MVEASRLGRWSGPASVMNRSSSRGSWAPWRSRVADDRTARNPTRQAGVQLSRLRQDGHESTQPTTSRSAKKDLASSLQRTNSGGPPPGHSFPSNLRAFSGATVKGSYRARQMPGCSSHCACRLRKDLKPTSRGISIRRPLAFRRARPRRSPLPVVLKGRRGADDAVHMAAKLDRVHGVENLMD